MLSSPTNLHYGLAICTPVPLVQGPVGPRIEPVTWEWHQARSALAYPTNSNYFEIPIIGKEVGEARNYAAECCITHKTPPEFLFFLDYDVLPAYDAITKLLYRARHFPDYDIFAGVYCCKSSPPEPLIYCDDGRGPFWDWTIGDLILQGVTGIHMGCTLIRTSLFQKIKHDEESPLFYTQPSVMIEKNGTLAHKRGTEDLYFCRRAIEEAGAKILVDTSVLCGHIHHGTGVIFGLPTDSGPVTRAFWMKNKTKKELALEEEVARLKREVDSLTNPEGDKEWNTEDIPPVEKCVLDIGAGATRREWPGYKTFTTDLRPEVKADFCRDTRSLNFPDNTWDMVASSHHLEHIGRFEQGDVWREMFRVLKPGGCMEHIVPNIAWAGAKIVGGEVDEHVYNVLYGAQESHGYQRELNTHFFGYTPAIARELAEEAGFVDVVVTSYKDDPDLSYNLVIRGRKPEIL